MLLLLPDWHFNYILKLNLYETVFFFFSKIQKERTCCRSTYMLLVNLLLISVLASLSFLVSLCFLGHTSFAKLLHCKPCDSNNIRSKNNLCWKLFLSIHNDQTDYCSPCIHLSSLRPLQPHHACQVIWPIQMVCTAGVRLSVSCGCLSLLSR